MSIILRPRAQFEHLDGLPLTGALAVALTLSSKFGVKAKVRWPNDVVFQGHKLAGTLVEAKLRGNTPRYALLGLGLNANFPGALLASEVEDATTLFDILGSPVDREELISQIL
jgi:BirA family biotin operon repressor/biotin-[acetyl-CoA-carboxylase] ligase